MVQAIANFLRSGAIIPTENASEFWIGWGTPDRLKKPSGFDLNVFAPDFFLKNPSPWYRFKSYSRLSRFELQQNLENLNSKGSLTQIHWNGAEKSPFQELFSDLQNRIKIGELEKAVPVIFDTADFSLNLSARVRILLNLLKVSQTAPLYVYGIWNPEEGMIGATPELLFRTSGSDRLATCALAGTRPKKENRTPLTEDPKELQEHGLVIRGITESLSGFSDIRVGKTSELELPQLIHLHTPIEAILKEDFDFEKTVHALHPTPALGAYPKERGWKWLKEQDSKSVMRERFGAPFGAKVNPNSAAVCLVAIRNIQWRAEKAKLGAGCGILSRSLLEREWDELRAKMDSVKRMAGLWI